MAVSAQYGKIEYWEQRYLNKKELFDWYQKWAGIKDIITQYTRPNFSILNIGCGTSKLPQDMTAEGFQNITNIDISSTVIEDMKLRYQEVENLKWEVKDVKTMDYQEGEFHAIIDKGTLDSILCGDRSSIMARRMMNQVYRVLAPGGVYFCVTYAPPEQRMDFITGFDWEVRTYQVSKPVLSTTATLAKEDSSGVHYLYVCIKAGVMQEIEGSREGDFDEDN